MKRKPKGPKYRNLFARGGVICYQRCIKLSTKTADWEEATATVEPRNGRIPREDLVTKYLTQEGKRVDTHGQRVGSKRLPLADMDVQAPEAPRRSGLRVHLTTRGPPGARAPGPVRDRH